MPHACRMLLFVVLGLAGCVAVSAQDKTFEDAVPLEVGSRLALEARRGSVRLTSWDRRTVEIHARIEPPPGVDADYARRAVEGATIEIRGNYRSVRIRTDYSGVPRLGAFSGSRTLPRVHYEIRAPRQLDLDLDIDRSDTTLEGFEGRLLLALDRSDLEASDLAGTIALELNRGDSGRPISPARSRSTSIGRVRRCLTSRLMATPLWRSTVAISTSSSRATRP